VPDRALVDYTRWTNGDLAKVRSLHRCG
jgi:hypothetical protein